MVKPVVRDVFFLAQKSEEATISDKQTIQDLLDTLQSNKEHCVGMAANMIGVNKRIIVMDIGFCCMTMVNPVIIKKSKQFETKEG